MFVRKLTPLQSIRSALCTPWLSSTWLVIPRTWGLAVPGQAVTAGQCFAVMLLPAYLGATKPTAVRGGHVACPLARTRAAIASCHLATHCLTPVSYPRTSRFAARADPRGQRFTAHTLKTLLPLQNPLLLLFLFSFPGKPVRVASNWASPRSA
jgi:hypothetical protein